MNIDDDIGTIIGEGERADTFAPSSLVWIEMAVRMAALRGYKMGLVVAMRNEQKIARAVASYSAEDRVNMGAKP